MLRNVVLWLAIMQMEHVAVDGFVFLKYISNRATDFQQTICACAIFFNRNGKTWRIYQNTNTAYAEFSLFVTLLIATSVNMYRP